MFVRHSGDGVLVRVLFCQKFCLNLNLKHWLQLV